MQKESNFLSDIKSQELKFDKKAIPAIIGFIVLVLVGLYLYSYWRSKRSEKLVGDISDQITVTSTIFPIFDITRNIVGENNEIEVVQLIPSGSNPLTFKSDLSSQEKITDSDIIFKIGVDFDEEALGDTNIEVVDLSEVVKLRSRKIDEEQRMEYYSNVCEDNGGDWLSNYYECENIDQTICENEGGNYNACASVCRHGEGGGCIEVCVAVCEFREVVTIEEEEIEVDYEGLCEDNDGDWLSEYRECEGISQEVCEVNSGEYFPCESACRHDEEMDRCIEVCIEVCQFREDSTSKFEQEDPYYWLSIANAKEISKIIYEKLADLKPDLKDTLYQNYSEYLESLDSVKSYIEGKIEKLEDKRLITFTDSFYYFADEYDLSIVASFNESELDDPSNEFLEELERKLDEYKIGVVYKEPDVSAEIIQNLMVDRDLEVRTLDPFGGSEKRLTYIDLMKFNADSISEEVDSNF